jgi:hypothetical protein
VESEKRVDKLDKAGAVVQTGSTTAGSWLGGALAAFADEGKNEAANQTASNFVGEVVGGIFGLGGGLILTYGIKKIFRRNRTNGVYLCPQCHEESIYER